MGKRGSLCSKSPNRQWDHTFLCSGGVLNNEVGLCQRGEQILCRDVLNTSPMTQGAIDQEGLNYPNHNSQPLAITGLSVASSPTRWCPDIQQNLGNPWIRSGLKLM